MANEQKNQANQATLQTAADEKPKAPSREGQSDLELLRAELRAELAETLKTERARQEEEFRVRMNEEREIFHAQVDAARAEANAVRATSRRLDVPVAIGDAPSPTERRRSRPLPTTGVVEMELTHGTFVGETMDKTYWPHQTEQANKPESDSFEPAKPGDVLRFDMKRVSHSKTAQMLRDSGCAERV